MLETKKITSVLFVCTGNICRSPTAHGIFLRLIEQAGLTDRFYVDSAGTHGYHTGEAPDKRSTEAARKRGYDLTPLRARELTLEDFQTFDYILAMDHGHYNVMVTDCPLKYREKIHLFMDYAPSYPETEVPDPYYGGEKGFEHVLDLIESGCQGLLKHILEQ